MDNRQIKQQLQTYIKHHIDDCFQLSTFLTEHPEVSGQEEKACATIADFLQKRGYDVETCYVGVKHAFVARKKSDTNKPKVAVMCEYDALPEIGHACGHSISCSISILAVLSLMDCYEDFPFQLDLIGTPAEELGGGKIQIINGGGFDGYAFAIMAHLYSKNAPTFNTLSATDLEVTYYGKSAHASTDPWEGVNALNATQLLFHAMDMMRQHVTPDVQMHGVIKDGGIMPNIVPDKSVSYWYGRAKSIKDLNRLEEKIHACIKGASIATGTTYAISEKFGKYAELSCGQTALKMITKIFEDFNMDYCLMEQPGGSTDAGNVDLLIPTFHPMIALGKDSSVRLHSKKFAELVQSNAGKESLYNGALVIGTIIETLAFEPHTWEKVKEEHKAYRK